MADTVTVTRRGTAFIVAFSRLPGRSFGPWDFPETVRDLQVSALLSPMAARDLVLAAFDRGSVTVPTA